MFYVLVEIGVIFGLLVLGLTQIVIPVYNSQPLFPWFRRRKVYQQIKAERETIEQIELQKEIQRLQNRAAKLKAETAENETADGSNFVA